jgi:predicted metal-binding membrane protein
VVNVEFRHPAAPAAVVAAALGLAAACWAAAAWLMRGMTVAGRPGPFGFFAAVWATMMAAMMLPGAAPAIARRARAAGGAGAALAFAASYLAIWVLAGPVVSALDVPHGTVAAGAVVIAAGAYELTPAKPRLRRRCRDESGSGLRFGLCCAGSSAGLMALPVALGLMSLLWMVVATVITSAQKLMPAKPAIDVPVALAIIGLGIVIIADPSLVPGLMPPAM